MGSRKDYQLRTLHMVFQRTDMKGGDIDQCWEWQGTLAPNPVMKHHGRLYQVRRIVYSLKKGIHVDDVPALSVTCGNRKCVNPHHLIPFATIAGIIARSKGITHAEAAKEANFLPKTKRGRPRVLTTRGERGTYRKPRKQGESNVKNQ